MIDIFDIARPTKGKTFYWIQYYYTGQLLLLISLPEITAKTNFAGSSEVLYLKDNLPSNAVVWIEKGIFENQFAVESSWNSQLASLHLMEV